jgi:hypothetical protein
MAVPDTLPPDVLEGATLRGNEYGWSVSSFSHAVVRAEANGYACLGGQFQFRLEDGSTCEMYWLNADSEERATSESWPNYVHRSCSEVLDAFQRLLSDTDFRKEASNWAVQINPKGDLVFVAYFVTENEWASLSDRRSPQA